MTDEEAKAIGKALEVIHDFGAYAGEILDTARHDLFALAVGDKLKLRRIKSAARLIEQAKPYLDKIDEARKSKPSPSVVIPLLEAAVDEERGELRDLWARLLANAAIDGGAKVRRDFIETVRQFEPLDALVFDAFGVQMIAGASNQEQYTSLTNFLGDRTPRGTHGEDFIVSEEALVKLICLSKPGTNPRYFNETPYGKALRRALTVT